MTSLSASRELMFVILPFLVTMGLGLQLPALSWSHRLRLAGLGASVLFTSNLGILALKVEEASRIAPFDRCSSILISFASQLVVFEERPPLAAWAGLALVLLATTLLALNTLYKARQDRK